VRVERSQLDPLYAHNLAMPDRPRVASLSDRVDRILHSGVWLTDLLWEGAARASQRFQPLGHTGLIGLALVMIAAIDGVWRRRWLGLAILGYMMVLIWIWPRPVARYFVPIAPLLIAEMFAGAAVLMRWLMSRRQGGLHVGTNLAIGCVAGSILLCSVAPYMNQVAQQRASNFYASFRGGAFQSLVNVAYKLHELNAPAGSIAMSRLEFVGRDQQKSTNSYLRAAIFVTDRPIRVLPPSLMAQPTRRLIGWSQRANVQYSLYQQRRRIVTRAAAATSISTSSAATAPIVRVRHGPPEWSIVTVHRGRLRHVPLQQIENWPRHVPGLSKARAGSR
ncbi:MAG TPA: hypothetical protein VNL70_02280, partial [Tepidisphaeraceae bacterium]|nr:hypothetical protein [Tepidisphaeraceae bacterium]